MRTRMRTTDQRNMGIFASSRCSFTDFAGGDRLTHTRKVSGPFPPLNLDGKYRCQAILQ